MKRIFSFLLTLGLLLSAIASAESIGNPIAEPKPEIKIDRVYKTLTFNGEESLTHGWIVADVTVTNFSLHTLSVKDDFSGTLLYDGLYEFAAEPMFAVSEFESLVRLSGSMVFRVPKLVLETESDKLMAMLNIDGEIIPLSLDFSENTKTVSAPNSFDTPEDLLIYFIDCLKAADFNGVINAFGSKEKAEHFSFEWYVKTYKHLLSTSGTFYPDYEAYNPLIQMGNLPTSQLNTMVLSLFAEYVPSNNMLMQYRNDMLTGKDIWEGEEITIDEYKERMNPSQLESLSLKKIYRVPIDPTGRKYTTVIRNSFVYGYRESRNYILSVFFEGEEYLLSATLCRFPEGWKILQLGNNDFNQVVNAPTGAFIKAENARSMDLSEMILTWKNGKVIEENLLKESGISMEDLIGTWISDEGAITFGDNGGKVISYTDNGEYSFVYRISDDYLYMLLANGNTGNINVCSITLKDDWLTMMSDQDEHLTLQKEK